MKGLVVCLSLVASLAAEPIFQKEVLGKKQATRIVQETAYGSYRVRAVRLSDNTFWRLYYCAPPIQCWCSYLTGSDYDEYDPRLDVTLDIGWIHEGSTVELYFHPFKQSKAIDLADVFHGSIHKAKHVMLCVNNNKMVFARPMSAQWAKNYYGLEKKPYAFCPQGYKLKLDQLLDDNLGPVMARSFLKKHPRFKHVVIRGPKGGGKKTLARAMTNKPVVEIDLKDVFNHGWSDQKFESIFDMAKDKQDATIILKNFPASASPASSPQELVQLLSMPDGLACAKEIFCDYLIKEIEKLQTYANQRVILLLDDADVFPQVSEWPQLRVTILSKTGCIKFLKLFAKDIPQSIEIEKFAELCVGLSAGQIKSALRIASENSCEAKIDESIMQAAIAKIGIHQTLETHIDGMLAPKDNTHSFADIIGYEKEKKQLGQVVDALLHPETYEALGSRSPQTLLLTGPSGVGKTLFAHALAKEANFNLYCVDAGEMLENSDEFLEVFEDGERATPCIICIENIDCYQGLKQKYLEVADAFMMREAKRAIVKNTESKLFLVVTATDRNSVHKDILSSLRTGFKIDLGLPPVSGREALLKHFSKGYVLAADCDLSKLATLSISLSPFDLKDIFTFAAKECAMAQAAEINQESLLGALKTTAHAKASENTSAQTHLYDPFEKKQTFEDVGGCTSAKEDLNEVIAFLRSPNLYKHLGVTPPKGVLLTGPPGCGKTLLARAVAGEANANFFHCSGPDLISKWAGVASERIREVFSNARQNTPAVLFIDEIDSIGSIRRTPPDQGGGVILSNNNIVNQLLTEMDGFAQTDQLIVIAATNRPSVLDPALLRPGRFDRKVDVQLPSITDRKEILQVHANKRKFAEDVDFGYLAQMTTGMSGADLAAMINEAAIITGRAMRSEITIEDIHNARDRVQMGSESKGIILSEQEKRNTAYHEAGHTVVGLLLDSTETVDKVTILPRGGALGITFVNPKGDYTVYSKSLKGDLAIWLGGFAAEKLFLNDTSSGVTSDLQGANKLARHMVCQCGMSERLGFLTEDDLSPETKRLIDEEVKLLLDEAFEKATALLREHTPQVEKIVDELLAKETLYRDDLDRIMAAP